MASDRHAQRLIVSRGAVLTLNEAAELLPVKDSEARAWLLDQGLVRDLLGRPVVRWADVLAALAAGDDPAEPAKPTPREVAPRRRPPPLQPL